MRALPLIITIMVLALMAAPALAADLTIPVNKDITRGDMVVHITKVEVTDKYKGNTYSADPDNTIWPKLWFIYENKGTVPLNGNLYLAFVDEKGNKYWDSRDNKPIFDATMDQISPGKKSDERFVEIAAPKGTKITQIIFYNDVGKQADVLDISYNNAVTATSDPTTGGGSSICGLSLLLPLLIVGALAAYRLKR